MITIKNRKTGETQQISYANWKDESFDASLLEVTAIQDVVHLFVLKDGKWIIDCNTERYNAIRIMDDEPGKYKFIPSMENTIRTEKDSSILSLFDRANSELIHNLLNDDHFLGRLTYNPKAMLKAPQIINTHAGNGVFKNSQKVVRFITKSDYFKFILIAIIGGLTVAYFVFIFKWNK